MALSLLFSKYDFHAISRYFQTNKTNIGHLQRHFQRPFRTIYSHFSAINNNINTNYQSFSLPLFFTSSRTALTLDELHLGSSRALVSDEERLNLTRPFEIPWRLDASLILERLLFSAVPLPLDPSPAIEVPRLRFEEPWRPEAASLPLEISAKLETLLIEPVRFDTLRG